MRQEYLSGDCDCPQVVCAALNERLSWETTVVIEKNPRNLHWRLEKFISIGPGRHKTICWPLLKPSWGALCPHPPLPGAEESGCWGWQMDQCPVLGHFTGKTSPAGCSGREESQLALLRRETLRTVPGAKNNWVGPGARVWAYSTFPVPVQFTPVPQRNSPERILVYTFKFISPSFWRLAFQELL